MNYEGFAIECYQAGKGLWHARLMRPDRNPMIVGGVAFSGQVIEGLDARDLRGLLDAAKQRRGAGVARQ